MSDTGHPGERPAVILDCDPGHDDAIAIVVAADLCDLVGITTVAGNAPPRSHHPQRSGHEGVARHRRADPRRGGPSAARRADRRCRRSTDSAASTARTSRSPPVPSTPTMQRRFIVESCRQRAGTWIVAVGPLTNVALALRRAPDLVESVAGISVMGGGRSATALRSASSTSGPTRRRRRSCSRQALRW